MGVGIDFLEFESRPAVGKERGGQVDEEQGQEPEMDVVVAGDRGSPAALFCVGIAGSVRAVRHGVRCCRSRGGQRLHVAPRLGYYSGSPSGEQAPGHGSGEARGLQRRGHGPAAVPAFGFGAASELRKRVSGCGQSTRELVTLPPSGVTQVLLELTRRKRPVVLKERLAFSFVENASHLMCERIGVAAGDDFRDVPVG